MNVEEASGGEAKRNRKTVLKEERLKEGKKERPVKVRKVERIVVEVLLDSGTIELVMTFEFAKRNKFRNKKLDRLIHVRNVDSIFNYEKSIEHTVEVELFYKEHKERIILCWKMLFCENK